MRRRTRARGRTCSVSASSGGTGSLGRGAFVGSPSLAKGDRGGPPLGWPTFGIAGPPATSFPAGGVASGFRPARRPTHKATAHAPMAETPMAHAHHGVFAFLRALFLVAVFATPVRVSRFGSSTSSPSSGVVGLVVRPTLAPQNGQVTVLPAPGGRVNRTRHLAQANVGEDIRASR